MPTKRTDTAPTNGLVNDPLASPSTSDYPFRTGLDPSGGQASPAVADANADYPAGLPKNTPGGTAPGDVPPTITGRRRVAIVGYTGHREDAPFADDNFELWGMNNLWKFMPPGQGRYRWDAWFELHTHAEIAADPEQLAWLQQRHPFPILMMPAALVATAAGLGAAPPDEGSAPDWWKARLPSVEPFPLDALLDKFKVRYFTNTPAWQVAFATMLLAGYADTEIGLWGVDMAVNTEYCQTAMSRVLTADLRWVEAGKIRVGDKLIGFDEEPPDAGRGRRYRTATVQTVQEVVRPTRRVEMADGSVLTCSAEHRWLTHAENAKRWRETDKLTGPNHRVGRPTRLIKLFDVWGDPASVEEALAAGYLAAAFDGEGFLSMPRQATAERSPRSISLGFAQRENEMSRRVDAYLTALGFDVFRHGQKQPATSKTTPEEWRPTVSYQVRGGRPEVLRFLGQVRPSRLLASFDPDRLGGLQDLAHVPVTAVEDLGEQTLIGIGTDCATYVCEGFASHNSRQRPSVEFYMGVAAGAGVSITVPAQSDLLKAVNLYGEDDSPIMARMRFRQDEMNGKLQEVRQRQAQLRYEDGQLTAMENQLIGALEQGNYWIGTWATPQIKDRDASDDRLMTEADALLKPKGA